MKILVDDEVIVTDADNLRELQVRSDLPDDILAERLKDAELGTVSGQHAWLSTERLAQLASALTDDPGWSDAYAQMLDYARSKSWCDDETGAVRAHITTLT